MQESFTIPFDELEKEKTLEELSREFPNLREQLPLALKAMEDDVVIRISALVPLLVEDSQATLFRMERSFISGHYSFEQDFFYHGISTGYFGEETERDPFDDLVDIMENGFHSECETNNVHITLYGMGNISFKPNQYLMLSRKEETERDCYLLKIRKGKTPNFKMDSLTPTTNPRNLLLKNVQPEDIMLMVNFSDVYDRELIPKRMEFYKKLFPERVGFYKGIDSSFRILEPKDFGL